MAEDGCTCQMCGFKYRVDILLPDDLWNHIRAHYTMLCGRCIMQRIEWLNAFDSYRLIKT